jgi:hypothetical protein
MDLFFLKRSLDQKFSKIESIKSIEIGSPTALQFTYFLCAKSLRSIEPYYPLKMKVLLTLIKMVLFFHFRQIFYRNLINQVMKKVRDPGLSCKLLAKKLRKFRIYFFKFKNF